MFNLNPLTGCDRYCLSHEVAWNSAAGEECFMTPTTEDSAAIAAAVELAQQSPQNDTHRVIVLGRFTLGAIPAQD